MGDSNADLELAAGIFLAFFIAGYGVVTGELLLAIIALTVLVGCYVLVIIARSLARIEAAVVDE
ncbi:hypothetical protein [Natronobacterium gregoryi]|uniref:Uncharacterized protein n=2 Tax=Natronobacterium gregoryi TaxID=44930 RepID=L0AG26_NATGS|nr:hypothetical protein [Natronobacterium gregoryi]AFZ72878.1 hypothetical protein Natgr_1679 [Natronobacterium gregoryi SP2]ELY69632.1 hypothetical protein C490_07506 [Natronobacterium gregoryi SP2]PLK21894.1 hypothetical protein CYV19_02010 [Natronobacterium gregoryi SP2]SFI66245.1 hypothetical protein SAMN05443661_10345 [Natronobacterium gregoryi]